MKNLTILSLGLVLISTGCEQTPPPAPSPPPPTTQSTMTPWETSLVGQWKLKRSEMRGSSYQGLGDSTYVYTNHYNYNNSLLELKSTLYTSPGGTQLYEGILGLADAGIVYQTSWYGANNQIFTGTGNYAVHYLSFAPDSLVLDGFGGQMRYFYNKSNTPPVPNNIESQLIGGAWQLVSTTYSGGSPTPSTTPTYKMFFSNWYNNHGYFSKDSTYLSNTSSSVSPGSWEVLFPNRPIPILYSYPSGLYSKITNLTATALTLEQMGNPYANSSTGATYIYSR